MSRKSKVILIGNESYKRNTTEAIVDSYAWNEIEKIKNICDYDTLIVDLLSRPKEDVDYDQLFETLNWPNIKDIIVNNGKIIIVGDPRLKCQVFEGEEKKEIPFLHWTGVDFYWDDSPGDTVSFKDDYEHRSFEEYVSQVKNWKYSLAHTEINKDQVIKVWNEGFLKTKGWEVGINKDIFCYNRYKNGLAFSIRHGFINKYTEESVTSFGPIIFLPEIERSEDETLQIILKDLCGVESGLPEPKWLEEFTAPGETEVNKKVERIETEIQNSQLDLVNALNEKEEVRTCLKLLYEREYALEPATRSILRQLGGHVEDPTEPNKEDGWVVATLGTQKYEGVLEIKSTKSDCFNEDGRKQLLDWIDRGISMRGKKYKGIFIGNSAVNKPLHERPYAFSDNWQKSAELNGICAIKTEELYYLYILKSQTKLDVDLFWKTLFETNGIFDIKPFLKAEGEVNKE